MSRSRKKHPFHGITTCASEKDDKRFNHKRERAHVRDRLHHDLEDPFTHHRMVSDPWGMGKDGKRKYSKAEADKCIRLLSGYYREDGLTPEAAHNKAIRALYGK